MRHTDPAKENKNNSQKESPPIKDVGLKSREENKISPKGSYRQRSQHPRKWPNRVIATSSFLLVLITGIYTYYAKKQAGLTEVGLQKTEEALTKNTNQFSETLLQMKRQASSAADAAKAAEKAADAASRNAESASAQVNVLKEQRNTDIAATRLEQRAWVVIHGLIMQTRESPRSEWRDKEISKAGEDFRVRFRILNVGKTPALKALVMNDPRIVTIGNKFDEDSIEWREALSRIVVFPQDNSIVHNTRPLSLSEERFSAYSNFEKELLFWGKIYYCDITGMRHWMRIGFTHKFGSGPRNFGIKSSSTDPDPGEPNHPDCQ